MKFNLKSMSEEELINRWALCGWAVIAVFLSIAYGSKSFMISKDHMVLTAFIIMALLVPLIFSYLIFKKDKKSKQIRRIMPISYGIALFSIFMVSKTPMTFLYAVPMMLLIVAFNNSKLMMLTMAILWLGCTASFVWCKLMIHSWEMKTDEVLIYFTVLPIMCCFAILSTKLAESTNKNKLDKAKEQANRIAEIVTVAGEIAQNVLDNASNSTDKLHKVTEATKDMALAMDNTVKGMESVRSTIEEQTQTVQEIKQQTADVLNAVESISTETRNSNKEFDTAKDEVGTLLLSSEKMSATASETVTGMTKLNEIMTNVSNIISIISEISGQTRLLSLNASIEAARAGEMGRGFAVVADEIGKLASQTGQATSDISSMIQTLTAEFNTVRNSISSLVQIGEEQKTGIGSVNKSFDRCKESIKIIENSAGKQNLAMQELNENTEKLAGSIDELCNMNEEVFSNAVTTSGLAKTSTELVAEVTVCINATTQNSMELKNVLKD